MTTLFQVCRQAGTEKDLLEFGKVTKNNCWVPSVHGRCSSNLE